MPLLDMRQSKNLTGMVIADIVLQLLSYAAQTERVDPAAADEGHGCGKDKRRPFRARTDEATARV